MFFLSFGGGEEVDLCSSPVSFGFVTDLHVYIKCTPALFKLGHFYRRLPEFLFRSLWTFLGGNGEKVQQRDILFATCIEMHIECEHFQCIINCLEGIYFTDLWHRLDSISIFQLIYFCIQCTNVVYFANVTM